MKNLYITVSAVFLYLLFAAGTFGQTPTVTIDYPALPCPADKVCISPEAARKAINDAAKVTALETESKAKDQAIADLKTLLEAARIEYAAAKGENSALKQNAVQDRAIIEVLLKSVRPKKIGLINLF